MKISLLSILMILGCFLMNTTELSACGGTSTPPPTVIPTPVCTTSTVIITIRFKSIQTFGGSQGQFCTCAFSGLQTAFSNITSVTFVNAGTSNPIAGFNTFNTTTASTNGWTTAFSNAGQSTQNAVGFVQHFHTTDPDVEVSPQGMKRFDLKE